MTTHQTLRDALNRAASIYLANENDANAVRRLENAAVSAISEIRQLETELSRTQGELTQERMAHAVTMNKHVGANQRARRAEEGLASAKFISAERAVKIAELEMQLSILARERAYQDLEEARRALDAVAKANGASVDL